MRKWFYLLLCFLPMLSCVGQKDDPTPELRLVADLTALNVTARESATFTVFSGTEDVTDYSGRRDGFRMHLWCVHLIIFSQKSPESTD